MHANLAYPKFSLVLRPLRLSVLPRIWVEICRDTHAAMNILKKGMILLGMEYQSGKCGLGEQFSQTSRAIFQDHSTFGQKESAEKSGKRGEKTASTMDGQPKIASGLL
jgi:putative transposase